MRDEISDSPPDWRLDLLFGVVLGSLLAAALLSGFAVGPVKKGPATVFTAIYLQAWGVLFLLSYFLPGRSYLLKGLMWLCEHTGAPRGRWTAVLWGAFAIVFSTFFLLIGLGVLPA
jgi:hypothetical protein